MTARDALLSHLASATTTTCRCWGVTRKDGQFLGFTDHDRDLTFDARTFRAASGMTARALQAGTGLSVDNSEAMGALSDASITETDIMAGRYDGAEITCWMVNWADVAARVVLFAGTFGEVSRQAGAFQAELRGLTDPLNQLGGRAYVKTCPAVLGDSDCGFDLNLAGYAFEVALIGRNDLGHYLFAPLDAVDGWLERGRCRILNGIGEGQVGLVKFDRTVEGRRSIELWSRFAVEPQAGDRLRLEAGCDKRFETCRAKFSNTLNFRGFPHLPGEDWLTSYPVSSQLNDGGSLVR